MKISRRKFFTRAIQTATVVAIPTVFGSFLESCKNTLIGPTGSQVLQSISGSYSGGNVTVNIDSSSPLAKTGSAAVVTFQGNSILIDHPSANVFNALSSICTHQSCQITGYDSGSNEFICPCHGSMFDVNGKVTQGPANAPLTKYQTQISGSQLIVKVS
ncbi:MAG TPA: Rieske (2Fe-2S) protein [Ignavibacteriaceae bacterium]|nr:Rieske (2Fe-2S) protein [Ignavibacteriaceae bacterium]